MLWQELEVSGDLSDGDLIGAWSKILDIDPDGVRVVDTMEDAPSISEARARIVLERWRQSGQFPLHVVIYVRGADLEERVSEPNAGLDVVRRFCSAVKSDCLLSDGDVNPYTMLLVRRTGEVSSVVLDGDALDRDELMLAAGQAAESPFMAVDRRESPRPA